MVVKYSASESNWNMESPHRHVSTCTRCDKEATRLLNRGSSSGTGQSDWPVPGTLHLFSAGVCTNSDRDFSFSKSQKIAIILEAEDGAL